MKRGSLGLLTFQEHYLERIWGGQKLRECFGKDIPAGLPIGEAWLISDHPSAESIVSSGPHQGKTLHQLVAENPPAILGSRAALTIHGRFPLLLKLLDAKGVLSVQVHPDDETAERLGEPDVGKTEMWHVLQADPDSRLICGLLPEVTPARLAEAVSSNTLEDLMISFPVQAGSSVFVPAGIVHAIGAGILLAEIQQNSDLTYRLYDWGRIQEDGTPRELHVGKSLESIHFGSLHAGLASPLTHQRGGAQCTVLAACDYFAAELLQLPEAPFERTTRGESFHILLGKSRPLKITTDSAQHTLTPGNAMLIPGEESAFTIQGPGELLDFYIPDTLKDIVTPLRAAGHTDQDISRVMGRPG